MSFKHLILSFVAGALLVLAIVWALQPKKPTYTSLPVYGVGGMTCWDWNNSRMASRQLENERLKESGDTLVGVMVHWVQGYRTASGKHIGVQTGKVLRSVEGVPALMGFIDKYCGANSKATIEAAGLALVTSLTP